jgi:hypothetical protein
MPYSEVEIWRGVLVPDQLLKEYYLREMEPEEVECDLKELYDDIVLHLNNELKDEFSDFDVGFQFTVMLVLCCAESKKNGVLFGIKIASYKRKEFDIKDCEFENDTERNNFLKLKEYTPTSMFCGKSLDGDECERDECERDESGRDKGSRLCGFNYVCDDCLGETTNGNYDVSKINTKIVECTTFNFATNRDERPANAGKEKKDTKDTDTKNERILTSNRLIDPLIKHLLFPISLDEWTLDIKNYYRVDDSLCTCH